jgi:hypothetical protein
VLIAGGSYLSWGNTAEIYMPFYDEFSLISSVMAKIRFYHTATPLLNGEVLIAGGTPDGIDSHDTAEIFDPALWISANIGEHTMKRSNHTATRLLDGRVLITGMGEYAEIYTPGP